METEPANPAKPPRRASRRRRWSRLVRVLAATLVLTAGCGIVRTEEPQRTRYGTAASMAEQAFPDGADVAVLASGGGFADALAAAPLAASLDAPILLTQRDGVPDRTTEALEELDVEEVVLLGGTASIGEAVADELAAVPYDIVRRAGDDRFETAAIVSELAFPDGADVALLARADDFADALAAAPLAEALDAPILLTARDRIPPVTLRALVDLGVREVVLLGGTGVISHPVERELEGGPFEVTRHAGADRFATAATIGRAAFPEGTGTALLANAGGFADALAAAPLARAEEAPILLTDAEEVPEATAEALAELGVDRVILLGGTAAVSEGLEEDLDAEFDVSRYAG